MGKLREGGSRYELDPPFCLPKEKIEMSTPKMRPSSFSDKKYRFDFSDEDRFNLDDEDVVSNFEFDLVAFQRPSIIRFKFLMEAISSWIGKHTGPECQWFSQQGCKCEFLLTRGGGWQKGRFRFRLEFIPDNPDAFLINSPLEQEKPQSPLDDLRSQLDTQ